MNRILSACALGLVLAVTACAGGGSTAAAPASSSTTSSASSSSPSTYPASTDPTAYLTELHDTLAGTNYAFVGDQQLLSLGHSMCNAIDKGVDRETLGRTGEESDIQPAITSSILHAATTHLCPEHAGF